MIEVSPVRDVQEAIALIKPDAFHSRDMIVKRLEDSGLYIAKKKDLTLPEDFVIGKFYSKEQLPKPIADATLRHFASGPSEILLIKGDNIAEKLLKLIGSKINPAECDEDTIRYIFGNHTPEQLEGDLKYYRNAAHKPRTDEERKDDLKKFEPLF